LSPTYPIKSPPIGLIKKADPKITNDLVRLEWGLLGSSGGKKISAMISEKNPNNEKSYPVFVLHMKEKE
jgi:hypothetical protein